MLIPPSCVAAPPRLVWGAAARGRGGWLLFLGRPAGSLGPCSLFVAGFCLCWVAFGLVGRLACRCCVWSVRFSSLFLFPCRLCFGAGAVGFLCLRCLGFVMSFASFVSALPVVGAVAPASRAAAAASGVAFLSGLAARALASSARAVAARVPRSSWSSCVEVVSVVRGADRVSVLCSDGRVRVCRVEYASRALGRPVSVDAVFSRLSARVGSSVCFLAAFGYSPDSWFVACFASDEVL